MFPVLQEAARQKVIDVLEAQFADNRKARALRPDGSYERVVPGRSDACAGAGISVSPDRPGTRTRTLGDSGPVHPDRGEGVTAAPSNHAAMNIRRTSWAHAECSRQSR